MPRLVARRGERSWPFRTFSAAARATFGAGAAAILFVGAGLAGYRLSRHERFVTGTPWAGETIWWQVALGAGFALLAIYSLRRARTLAAGLVEREKP